MGFEWSSVSQENSKRFFGLVKHQDPEIRHLVITQISEKVDSRGIDFSQALELLQSVITEKDEQARRLAAQEYLELARDTKESSRQQQYDARKSRRIKETPGLLDKLFTLAADKDPQVRYKILNVLTRIQLDPKKLIPLLTSAIIDSHEQTRQMAIDELALLALQTSEATKALIAAYPKLNRDDQIQLVQALGKIGKKAVSAYSLLKEATHNDDQRLREAAAESLTHVPVRTN